jgi:hypothetical protein
VSYTIKLRFILSFVIYSYHESPIFSLLLKVPTANGIDRSAGSRSPGSLRPPHLRSFLRQQGGPTTNERYCSLFVKTLLAGRFSTIHLFVSAL